MPDPDRLLRNTRKVSLGTRLSFKYLLSSESSQRHYRVWTWLGAMGYGAAHVDVGNAMSITRNANGEYDDIWSNLNRITHMPKLPAFTKKKPKPSLNNLVDVRRARGENQHQFWSRFGVTQSGGSRYESGRAVPPSTGLLVMLFLTGVVDDVALAKAKKAAGR